MGMSPQAHGTPDLRPDRALAGGQEFSNSQLRSDPFEGQPDLPAILVQRGNGDGRQRGVVGLEEQRIAGLGILEMDAAQVRGIVSAA